MNSLERQVIEPAQLISDPEERLRAIIANHVRIITSGSESVGFNPVTVVVDEIAGLSVAQRRKITLRKRVYVDLIRDTLRQLQEQGKLEDVDLTVIAFSLLGMILWLARWYRPNRKLTGDQVANEITKLANIAGRGEGAHLFDYGHADLGLLERARVVQAVAHHHHLVAGGL